MGKLTHTVSGSVASFRSADRMPIDNCNVGIWFSQSGSGDPDISNIRPITPLTGCNLYQAGQNIFDNENAGWVERKYLNANGAESSNSSYHYTANYIPVCPNTAYTFSLTKSSVTAAITVCKYDINKTFTERIVAVNSSSSISQSGTITTDSDTFFVRFSCYDGATNVMIEVGANEHTNYSSSMYKAYSGTKTQISWQNTAGNVFAGSLDVVTGVLTATHAVKVLDGTESWSYVWGTSTANGVFRITNPANTFTGITTGTKYANFSKNRSDVTSTTTVFGMYFRLTGSNPYLNIRNSMSAELGERTTTEAVDEWKALLAQQYANNTPFQIVYPLETPVTYQLTPQEMMTTLLDYNNIWSDAGGDTEVTYEVIDHLEFLRRRMMLIMASGANYVSGTFTVPDDGTSTYTLNFGKTFSKYLFFIELTDASKTIVINSGSSNYRPFCLVGSYPQPQINNVNVYGGVAWTYSPSLNSGANGRFSTASSNFTETSMQIATADVTSTTTSALLKGCTYNYYIFEIK